MCIRDSIEEQAKKTGTSIPSLVGGDSNFYRDQQAMIAVLELTNQHLGELAAISGEVRAGQEPVSYTHLTLPTSDLA